MEKRVVVPAGQFCEAEGGVNRLACKELLIHTRRCKKYNIKVELGFQLIRGMKELCYRKLYICKLMSNEEE